MTDKEAIKIIQMERNHCATHNRDAGKSEEYHKEMQSLVDAYDIAIKALEDTKERTQGKWIEGFHDHFETLDCSCCGYVRNERHLTLNFCPNCGAKMN